MSGVAAGDATGDVWAVGAGAAATAGAGAGSDTDVFAVGAPTLDPSKLTSPWLDASSPLSSDWFSPDSVDSNPARSSVGVGVAVDVPAPVSVVGVGLEALFPDEGITDESPELDWYLV